MSWSWETDSSGRKRRLVDEIGETVLEAIGPPEAALRIRSEADAMFIALAESVTLETLARPGGLKFLRGILHSHKMSNGREEEDL